MNKFMQNYRITIPTRLRSSIIKYPRSQYVWQGQCLEDCNDSTEWQYSGRNNVRRNGAAQDNAQLFRNGRIGAGR